MNKNYKLIFKPNLVYFVISILMIFLFGFFILLIIILKEFNIKSIVALFIHCIAFTFGFIFLYVLINSKIFIYYDHIKYKKIFFNKKIEISNVKNVKRKNYKLIIEDNIGKIKKINFVGINFYLIFLKEIEKIFNLQEYSLFTEKEIEIFKYNEKNILEKWNNCNNK